MPPPEVPVDESVVRAIAARHGIACDGVERLASPGIINVVYGLGEHHVLRVPRDHPIHLHQAAKEAETIPKVVAAGVTTPPLVAYDDSCELLPVPYLVVERVHGRDIESRGIEPPDDVLREVGRQLAVVHTLDGPADSIPTFDVHALIDERVEQGWFSAFEARWLHPWIDELEGSRPEPMLAHGDVQLSNILVDDDHRFVALLDWGCAVTAERSIDFMPLPYRCVGPLLDGYREAGGEIDDDRILWARFVMLLSQLGHGANPGTSWGERPVAWLTDLMGFFAGRDRR